LNPGRVGGGGGVITTAIGSFRCINSFCLYVLHSSLFGYGNLRFRRTLTSKSTVAVTVGETYFATHYVISVTRRAERHVTEKFFRKFDLEAPVVARESDSEQLVERWLESLIDPCFKGLKMGLEPWSIEGVTP